MLISCSSTKGGVGKTTIATNIACCAAHDGLSVLIVDGDKQKSSLYWQVIRSGNDLFGEIQVVGMPTKAIHKDLPRLSESYDVTLIDCGGGDSNVLRSAIIACGRGVVREEGGIALITVGSSLFDLWGVDDTVEALNEARSLVDIKSYLLLNNIMSGTKASKSTISALANIEDITLLETKIHTRSAFKNAAECGMGVVEYEPRGKAAAEVTALWQELKHIHNNLKGGNSI